MDFTPYSQETDSIRQILRREIIHFQSLVLVVAAIAGALYAYDSAVANRLPGHHRAEIHENR